MDDEGRRRPLAGLRVVVTRPRPSAEAFAELLQERGALAIVAPTISIGPPTDARALVEAASQIERYDWIVFTSANGVEALAAELHRQGHDTAGLAKAYLAVVGPGTAKALERLGLSADLVAQSHHGEGLALELRRALAVLPAHQRVLIPRAEVARDVVPDTLRAIGCAVEVVAAYATHPTAPDGLGELRAMLERRAVDVVTFTSSSTVRHLCDALGAFRADLFVDVTIATIGPPTSETARAMGLRVDVEATVSTLAGLVSALEDHFHDRAAFSAPDCRK